jgi:hypothetical protein
MAWSSRWSPDLVRFFVGDRCSILSIVCGVLHLCAWMMACGGVSLLRLCQVKMTSLGFGDHGEDPRLTCHKVSGSSLAIARFIGSKSIFECDGALPDLGVAVIRLFFRYYHSGSGGRWTMFRRGTGFSKGELVVLLLVGFFVQSCLTQMFVLCSDHMCNLCKQIV